MVEIDKVKVVCRRCAGSGYIQDFTQSTGLKRCPDCLRDGDPGHVLEAAAGEDGDARTTKVLAALRAVVDALKPLDQEQVSRVLKAAAVLHELEVLK